MPDNRALSKSELEDLAGKVAAELREPVDKYVERLEGVQNLIPDRVYRGLQSALGYVQSDIQGMVETKLKVLFADYAEALAAEKRRLRTKTLFHVLTAVMIFFVSGLVIVCHMVPSFKEISKERSLLQSLTTADWETPEEFYNSTTGKLYVKVVPETQIVKRNAKGKVETFYELATRGELSH